MTPTTTPTPSAALSDATRARVVAADALDGETVGALVESCAGTACHDRLEISTDGGTTWRVGPTMPRYGAESRLDGLVAIDARHWFAYGSSGWTTGDAGVTWRRSGGGGVAAAGRAGADVWVVRARCPQFACRRWIDVLTPAGAVVRHTAAAWLGRSGWVESLLWTRDAVYVVAAHQGGDRLEVLNTALEPQASRPLPTAGLDSLVRNGSALALLIGGGEAAGAEPKTFWTSRDDGRTWQRRPDPLLRGYGDSLQAPRSGLLWRSGYRSELWRSSDDGRTWKPLLANRIGDAGYELQAFSSYGDSAWAFTWLDDSPRLGVYRTTDAGAHWRAERLPSSR